MSRYITNPNRWVIVTESYSGLLRKGVELLNKTVTDFYKDFLSVYTMDDLESGVLEKCNVILLGKNTATPIQKLVQDKKITPCTKAQGYSIVVAAMNTAQYTAVWTSVINTAVLRSINAENIRIVFTPAILTLRSTKNCRNGRRSLLRMFRIAVFGHGVTLYTITRLFWTICFF